MQTIPTPRQKSSYGFRSLFNQGLLVTVILILVSCSGKQKDSVDQNWIPLFNGKNLNGWQIKFSGHELGENYLNTFRVQDGKLVVSYDNYEQFDDVFGHIYYQHPYSRYILRLEYRFTGEQVAGGAGWAWRNNGVMLHCQSPETLEKDQNFPVSVEVQLLGGDGQAERTTANVCTPGTHVVMEGELVTRHCNNSASKTFHGDQWVSLELGVYGNDSIVHRVNGEKVMSYTKPQLDPDNGNAQKLMEQGQSLMLHAGYIALQAESHPTEFRNIELLELKAE